MIHKFVMAMFVSIFHKKRGAVFLPWRSSEERRGAVLKRSVRHVEEVMEEVSLGEKHGTIWLWLT